MKKLIPAICMTLIAAFMLASSTFAWFSMNTTVTANGMNVEAKSDSLFLAIQEGDSFNPATADITATSSKSTAQLLPIAHGTVEGGNGTPTAITVAADMTTPAKWFYAYSNSPTDHAQIAGKATVATTLTGYIASDTFTVGVHNNSGVSKAKELTITSVTIPANTGIAVVIVAGTTVFEYKATNASATDVLLAGDFTTQTITVYYYIDGTNPNVKTQNVASLHGQVVITLSAKAAAAA